jgi:hypothetical protein
VVYALKIFGLSFGQCGLLVCYLSLVMLFVIWSLFFLVFGSVFGYGACFLEMGVVVGGGFRAPRTPRGAYRLESVARRPPRLSWCLESVWAWHTHALRASVR